MHRALLAALLLLVCAAWHAAASPKAAPPDGPPVERRSEHSADLADKFLMLSFKSDLETGAYLEQAALRRLGRQEFLVGISLDLGDGEDWTAGRRMWIPVDDISMILEFDTLEELREATSTPLFLPTDALPRA